MTTKKVETAAEQKAKAEDAKKTQNVLTPEKDEMVKSAKLQEDKEQPEINDDKESKAKVKEHEEFVEGLGTGEVKLSGDVKGTDLSTIKKPLVADPNSGRPVYETNEQYLKSEAAKGNL